MDMEVTKIKVKVKTLDKRILEQLELREGNFTDSEVMGYVSLPRTGAIVLILYDGRRLQKMNWSKLFDVLAQRADAPRSMDPLRKYADEFIHKFDQIFL